MYNKIGIELSIYIVISSLYLGWKRYRSKKRLGKLVGQGKIVGSYSPHRVVFGLTEYVLSLLTMAVVSLSNKTYIMLLCNVITLLLVCIYDIGDLIRGWNIVKIYEQGIRVNAEEYYFDMMEEVRREGDKRGAVLVKGKRRIEYEEEVKSFET